MTPRLMCCVWELTLRCNLRCRHCGATAGQARSDELSTAEALRVADELAGLPADEVTLMGGELFLRPDWLAVAERLRRGGAGLVIFTNGTLLNPERIAQLRDLAPRTIGTSLDGGSAAVHDAIRGVPGAFEKTLAAIDDLQAAGLRVSVITTLTRRNLYELPAIARLLIGRDIRWQIQVAGAGGGRLAQEDLLTPLEFYFAALFIARMRATLPWRLLPVTRIVATDTAAIGRNPDPIQLTRPCSATHLWPRQLTYRAVVPYRAAISHPPSIRIHLVGHVRTSALAPEEETRRHGNAPGHRTEATI